MDIFKENYYFNGNKKRFGEDLEFWEGYVPGLKKYFNRQTILENPIDQIEKSCMKGVEAIELAIAEGDKFRGLPIQRLCVSEQIFKDRGSWWDGIRNYLEQVA